MPAVRNPFHEQQPRHKHRDSSGGGLIMTSFRKAVVYGSAGFVLLNMMVLAGLHVPSTDNTNLGGATMPSKRGQDQKFQNQVRRASAREQPARQPESNNNNNNNNKASSTNIQCSFRQYPPRRYYGLQKLEQPDFLTQVDYVYGEYPIMVQPDYQNSAAVLDSPEQGKLCVDQSEWLSPEKNNPAKELPFADGTNPSILSLDRLDQSYPELVQKWRRLGASFIATICMTDSQCSYQDTQAEIQQYKLSREVKATVVQTLLLLLDDHFQTLQQTTIYLERDAPWGRKFKKAAPKGNGDGYEWMARALDDARLFIHLNKLWVSYREGPSFGYEKQVLNEIHLSTTATTGQLTAVIKASESASFCCGRNMALMEHLEDPTQLQSLTWADPVTVIDVNDGRKSQPQQQPHRRQLAEGKKKKSHFHGTNAFMVYLPHTEEFLGIGHFHRPHGRDAFNPYARFGHHYTHTFFTISSRPPFRLLRLSQEFVLPSKSKILRDDDADIIQFLSGLEVITTNHDSDNNNNDNPKDYAVIAYGINDCEGAAIYLSMDKVNQLLRPVPAGKEVVDLMEPLKQPRGRTKL